MSSVPVPQFWMVVGVNQGPPRQAHATRDRAAAEARRLARNNPGVVFVVLEAVEAIVKREFDTVTFRAAAPKASPSNDSDIPF